MMMMMKRTVRAVPDPRQRFLPHYIGTGDCHNPPSSQSHRPIMPLPSRPNGRPLGLIVRVSYGYVYTHSRADNGSAGHGSYG